MRAYTFFRFTFGNDIPPFRVEEFASTPLALSFALKLALAADVDSEIVVVVEDQEIARFRSPPRPRASYWPLRLVEGDQPHRPANLA